jgi:hypothetical protein
MVARGEIAQVRRNPPMDIFALPNTPIERVQARIDRIVELHATYIRYGSATQVLGNAGEQMIKRAFLALPNFVILSAIDYDRDILAHLASYSLGAIGAAIRVSPRYASVIRAGEVRPHRRHWAALQGLVARNRRQ